jgi:hypothetical protein
MAEEMTGGCACGSVRYRLESAPYDTGWCHCRTCQLSSGAPAMVFSTVVAGDYRITDGEEFVRDFESSAFGTRRFCGRCGSLLTIQVNFQEETIDFTVASLDQPGSVRPGFHIFYGSRIAWFDPGDNLPRHERFRPETRGLGGTEPPA